MIDLTQARMDDLCVCLVGQVARPGGIGWLVHERGSRDFRLEVSGGLRGLCQSTGINRRWLELFLVHSMEGFWALASDPALLPQSLAIDWFHLLSTGGVADLVRSRVHVMVLADAYNKKTHAISSNHTQTTSFYLPTEKWDPRMFSMF